MQNTEIQKHDVRKNAAIIVLTGDERIGTRSSYLDGFSSYFLSMI